MKTTCTRRTTMTDPNSNLVARLARRAGAALFGAALLAACATDGLEGSAPVRDEATGSPAAAAPAELQPGWQSAAPSDVDDSDGAPQRALTFSLPSKYSAVFTSGAGYRTDIDKDWTAFTTTWSQWSNEGYRLIDLDTTVRGGVRRYTGVYQPGSGGYALWAGVDWNSFVSKWSELSSQGLRLVDFETYLEGGQRVYTGVYLPGTDGYALWVGVDWNNFVAKWQELSGQGLRLVDIEVWEDGGQLRYGGVFRAGTDGYALWVGDSWNGFSKKWMELSAVGLRLVDLEPYTFQGARLYAGVFRAGGGAYDLVGASSRTALETRIAALASEGKRPVEISYEDGSDMPPPGMAAAFHDVIDGHAVGYSFAVAQGGQISSAGGFGYARAPWEASGGSLSMTGTKRSHLASISKPITATALMNLLEVNPAYNLDTPFMNILGVEFGSPAAGMSQVTLRNLLQHKSGMKEWGYCGPDLHTSLQQLISTPMTGTAGVTSQYSNGNYCLLRRVVEKLSGTDYVTYVRDNVFAPMGITDMSCTPDAVNPMLYYKLDTTSDPGFLWTDDYAGHCGAYGWYGSSTDLAKFLLGLRANTVLSAATFNTMTSQNLGLWAAGTVSGTGYHHNGAWITGDGRGFNGAIIHLPDATDAVVLINTNGYIGNGDQFQTVGTLVDGFNRMQAY
jgi:CubicO group peptidase (beta-lactamase class C family)